MPETKLPTISRPRGRSTERSNDRRPQNDSATTGEMLSPALGWLSLGLGAAQVAAPAQVARLVGLRPTGATQAVMRVIGARELGAGTGLLRRPRSAWRWARVAGDAMDLALLALVSRARGTRTSRVGVATAALAGFTALDVVAGRGRRDARRRGAEREQSVTAAITVNKPVPKVYRAWRDLERLPRFMTNLESVRVLEGGRSHWVATGPARSRIEWDAEIAEDRPDELIAWRSVPGSSVTTSGAVRFLPAPAGQGTEVRVELAYQPPAGRVGAALTSLLGENPRQQVSDDLRRFKQVIETGSVTVSDASPHGVDAKAQFLQRSGQPAKRA